MVDELTPGIHHARKALFVRHGGVALADDLVADDARIGAFDRHRESIGVFAGPMREWTVLAAFSPGASRSLSNPSMVLKSILASLLRQAIKKPVSGRSSSTKSANIINIYNEAVILKNIDPDNEYIFIAFNAA
ncbi:hypothetical protein ACFQU2_00795 [Siccirubricoccus deserti]